MKDLCVMKFGGTCLAEEEERERSADFCMEEIGKHRNAVVVVSAMGRKGAPYSTDTLLGLARDTVPSEKSSLIACGEIISAVMFAQVLRNRGVNVEAVTGWNAGLKTNGRDCEADLESIEMEYLKDALTRSRCIVVAGFQGMSSSGRISTLGRGGSDITAAAIAAALDADQLILFKTVDSVYTADPSRVPGARKIERISAEDLRQLAWQGAKVVHPRASEIASDSDMKISIRSHSTGEQVTEIEPFVLKSGRYITGVASGHEAVQFLVDVPREGPFHRWHADIFDLVTEAGVSMDMFSVFDRKVMFTVRSKDMDTVCRALDSRGLEYNTRESCVKVSIVGAGMHGMRGVMARFSSALSGEGIEMLQTVDSHATISALVYMDRRDEALRALHREFLEQ